MAKLAGVSMIPVIEALHRLENEGLVDSEPHFGSRVIPLTRETIRDRFILRVAVECQAVRTLAARHDEQKIGHLILLSDDLDAIPRDDEHEEQLREKHYAFHLALAEYTDAPSLVQTLHRLNLFDLLHGSIKQYSTTHNDVPKDHHRKIVDVIASGDPDRAEKAMREHIFFSGLFTPEEL